MHREKNFRYSNIGGDSPEGDSFRYDAATCLGHKKSSNPHGRWTCVVEMRGETPDRGVYIKSQIIVYLFIHRRPVQSQRSEK